MTPPRLCTKGGAGGRLARNGAMPSRRLSVDELMALVSPPIHAVLSNLSADPIQAVADLLAAHDECEAPRLEAEVPGVLQSPSVRELEQALERAVNAYLQAEPIPEDARRFLAEVLAGKRKRARPPVETPATAGREAAAGVIQL